MGTPKFIYLSSWSEVWLESEEQSCWGPWPLTCEVCEKSGWLLLEPYCSKPNGIAITIKKEKNTANYTMTHQQL